MNKIIEKALDNILLNNKPYAPDKFEKLIPISKFSDLKIPSYPGERTSSLQASEHVERGSLSTKDARTSYQANRSSIQDGLDILFPEKLLMQYIEKSIKDFNFQEKETNTRYYQDTDFVKVVPKEYNKSLDTDSIITINRDNDKIESVFTNNNDNRNLHNIDLIRAYEFLIDNPEYGLGLKWLAGTITDYAKELRHEIENNPKYSLVKSTGLMETLDMLAHPAGEGLMDNRLVLGVASSISYEQDKLEDPAYIQKQIKLLSKPNIFKFERKIPEGDSYTGICPASRFILGTLTKEVNGEMNLLRFINKIKEVRSDNNANNPQKQYVDKQCIEFSQMMKSILNEPESKKAVNELKPKTSGCPFSHQKK